jgi:tetratricopeptide (TPR) repeat protein
MAERPTPHSITVCALIALHCEEHSILYNGNEAQRRQVDAFLQDCLLHHHSDSKSSSNGGGGGAWSRQHATTVASFLRELETAVGNDVATHFTDWLTVAAQSIDSLQDLVMTLQVSVEDGSVDAVSANGVYLRQVAAGYDQLTFESVALLWKDLKHEMDHASAATKEATTTTTFQAEWPLSPAQMEQALAQECLDMGIRRDDRMSFAEREVEIQRVLQQNPELPYAHFLRFLNCLQAGERVGAKDALHCYFDYQLIQRSNSTGEGGGGGKEHEILQFAAILLAAMHSQFGDAATSLLATEEAVRVAQQSKDAACVAFSLGWLYSNATTNASNNNSEAGELIRRCVQRAMENNLRPLAAGANLSLARQEAGSASAWTHLQNASTDPPTADATNRLDRPTHMTHFSSGDEAMQVLARQRLVAAGIWDSFGLVALSALSAQIALHCHADQILSRDVVTAVQNIARVAMFGSTSAISLPAHNGDVLACHLESLELVERPRGCIYAEALANLVGLREYLGLPVEGVFCLEIALVVHEWAVRRGEMAHADALGVVLESSLHPRIPNLTEVRIDVYSQKCLRLSRQGRWDEAKALVRDLIAKSKEHGLHLHRARLLMQLAMINLESCPDEFTSALSPLLECLTLTDECNADGLHAAALSVLAQVHYRMRKHKRAIAVLQASLPTILQQEHVWIQAEAYLTLAKCYLQRAKEESANKNKVPTKLLRLAIRELATSEDIFGQCQDCERLKEVYYLQARVYNALPNGRAQRDEASQRFVRTTSHLTSCNKPVVDDFVNTLTNTSSLARLLNRPVPGIAY